VKGPVVIADERSPHPPSFIQNRQQARRRRRTGGYARCHVIQAGVGTASASATFAVTEPFSHDTCRRQERQVVATVHQMPAQTSHGRDREEGEQARGMRQRGLAMVREEKRQGACV